MSMLPPPVGPVLARVHWQRFLFRFAAVLAVVLGGWCLWLGLQSAPQRMETKALHPQDADGKSAPNTELVQAKTPSARITQIAENDTELNSLESRVVPAKFELDDAERANRVTVTGYESPAAQHPHQKVPTEREQSAGAWLTGTIEGEDAATPQSIQALPQVPAWKRGMHPLSGGLQSR